MLNERNGTRLGSPRSIGTSTWRTSRNTPATMLTETKSVSTQRRQNRDADLTVRSRLVRSIRFVTQNRAVSC